jgi:hypothetical protein
MKIQVTNRIPGKKAKAAVPAGTNPKLAAVESKADEIPAAAETPENRESTDDRNRKSAARRAFDSVIRGRLKNSRKR